MQGGLVQSGGSGGGASGQYHTMGATGGGPPEVTGAPGMPGAQPAPGGGGAGPGTTVAVDTSQMGPVDTLLAGTAWTREDVELVLQTISTALLLYWAVTEVTA